MQERQRWSTGIYLTCVQGGHSEWLLVDKHMVDINGATCNKIGVKYSAFAGQENRCYQRQDS